MEMFFPPVNLKMLWGLTYNFGAVQSLWEKEASKRPVNWLLAKLGR